MNTTEPKPASSNAAAPPILYHYCRPTTLLAVYAAERILPTLPHLRPPTRAEILATQTGPQTEAGSPLVVWLTEAADPGTNLDHGLHPLKTTARLVVSTPDAQRWAQWAPQQPNSVATWLDRMDVTGGKLGHTWWIVVGPVPITDIVGIEWLTSDGWTPAASLRSGKWEFSDEFLSIHFADADRVHSRSSALKAAWLMTWHETAPGRPHGSGSNGPYPTNNPRRVVA